MRLHGPEDLLLELGELGPGERGEEEGCVLGPDVPHAPVQEPPLEDVAALPPADPFRVIERLEVVEHIEGHPRLEEAVEVVVDRPQAPELFLQEEPLHLSLLEDLPRVPPPPEPLEVVDEHVLIFPAEDEVPGRDDPLLLEVPQRLFQEVLLEVEDVCELVRGRGPVDVEVPRDETVEGGLEALPLDGPEGEHGLLEPAAVDRVRPLEPPEDLAHLL